MEKIQSIFSTTDRDNTPDSPCSADTAQVPPTEWGSRRVAQPGHSIQVDVVGGGQGSGFTQSKVI